ncbi:hypothetical protein GCM10018780_73920 [Streptomyces lanatus]|nr:hypothetical protein GCM10018780_73920 [Streptomyces lanatus]
MKARPTYPAGPDVPFWFPVAITTPPMTPTAPSAMSRTEQGSPVMAPRRPVRMTVASGAGEGVCEGNMVREPIELTYAPSP